MIRKILAITTRWTIGLGFIAAAYAVGAGIIPLDFDLNHTASAHPRTEVVTTPTVQAKLVSTHTIEYVQETVVETEYVDVVKEVKPVIGNFDTLDNLEDWVEDECRKAIVRFNNARTVIDCDDYAQEMQRTALEDGFIISFEIISISEYNELFAIPLPEGPSLHAINLAIVGNSVFYIEPQTGEIVHAAYLD